MDEQMNSILVGKESYLENFKQWDESLTAYLDHPVRTYFQYYPPVYVVVRSLQALRPYYNIQKENSNIPNVAKEKKQNAANRDKQHVAFEDVSQETLAESCGEIKEDIRMVNDTEPKSTYEDEQKKKNNDVGENNESNGWMFSMAKSKKLLGIGPQEDDKLFGHTKEDDAEVETDDELEGEYSFYNSDTELEKDEDQKSVKSLVSLYSQKSEVDKELHIHLVSNYVKDPQESKSPKAVNSNLKKTPAKEEENGIKTEESKKEKSKYKRVNSLKRIFNKK